MSTGRPKDIHTKILPVDEGIEILILQYLAKYSQKDYQFHDYAKSKRGILGSQSSSATQKQQQLRKRAKNRLYYLRTNTPVLFRLLRERGFKTFEGCAIPTEDQVDTDQEEDDISSNPLEDNEDIQLKETPPRHEGRFEKEDTMSAANYQYSTDGPTTDIDIDLENPSTNIVVMPVLCRGVMLPQKGDTTLPTSGKVSTVDKIIIYFNVVDVQDFIDQKITAQIDENGGSITFNGRLCVPRIFHNNLHTFLSKMNPDAQEAEIKAHGYAAHQLNKCPELQVNKFRLKLPGDMTVNNDFFNQGHEGKEDLQLKICVRKCGSTVTGVGKKKIEQVFNVGFFSVAVDNTEQHMDLVDDVAGRTQHDIDMEELFASEVTSSCHHTKQGKKPNRPNSSSSSLGGFLSQTSSGIKPSSCKSTPLKSTSSSSDGFLGRTPALKLKDFTTPSSGYKSTTTAAANRCKNKNTNSRNPPALRHDRSSIADDGEEDRTPGYNREDIERRSQAADDNIKRQLAEAREKRTREAENLAADIERRAHEASERRRQAADDNIKRQLAEAREKRTREAENLAADIQRRAHEASERRRQAADDNIKRQLAEAREKRTREAENLAADIQRRAHEASKYGYGFNASKDRERRQTETELRDNEILSAQARYKRTREAEKLAAKNERCAQEAAKYGSTAPASISKARGTAKGKKKNAAPSAVISSPVPTQQQQQQHEFLHVVNVDLASELLLATPPVTETHGLDTNLFTPMKMLSGDDPSAYAGIQQDLPPSSFSEPATTGSRGSSFSLEFDDLEEEFDRLSVANQQIVQPTATATATTVTDNFLFRQATEPTKDPSETPGTIVDVARADEDLFVLVEAVVRAGLVDTLSSAGPFTVFAPTNAAWTKRINDQDIAVLDDLDKLKKILLYHTVADTYTAADITDGLTLTTVQGETIELSTNGDAVLINGNVRITGTDILASNGVIHTIDVVLFPSQLPEREMRERGDRRAVKAKIPQRPQRLASAILEARKHTESGTAPVFDFGSPQSTLRTFSIRKSVGIETRIIDTPLSTRDGGTTDPVASSHLEEDSDVSDIQVGLDSLSIVAGKKDVEDMRNKLETKKKAAEDRKNIHARMIAKKIALTNTLREDLEEAKKKAKSRKARYLIRDQKEALEVANKEVDSLSADYDTVARIEDSELDEEHAILMKKMGELENQEALEKSDDIVPSEEKAKSTALLPVRRDLRVDAGALSYNMECRQEFIYRHNVAYLECKNNHNGDDCVTFFVPMNLALGSAGTEEFYPANYTISGDRSFKSLLKDQRVATIGTTTLHFFEEDLEPKVTISGGEGVAKIVLSFHSKSDNARVHLIDRVLEEVEAEITDEDTLSSIGATIATGTTFGDCSTSQMIVEFPSNLALLPSQEYLTSRRPTAMSSMSICSNKNDTNNLLTVAAARTEDNCDNMSYVSTKDDKNVAIPGSTGLEEINEAMSLTSLQDTKKYDISVLPESIKQKETLPDGGANTNHQQSQQQAIVLRFRNKQGDDLPTGFYHDHQVKFSIGECALDERAAKRFLHLNPDRTYSRHAMKTAYKDRILQTHPDHRKEFVLKEDRERSDDEFRNVRAAWKILDRDDKINRPIPATPRASYDTDTQYANDLKKNLESFVTLEKFLAQLNKLTSARYTAFEEPPFQLSASQLASYRQRNLTIQINALEAGLAKVERRAPIQSLHGVEIDIIDAVIWKNSERFSIRGSIEKLRRSPASGNEQLAIADPTTRVAYIMQSHYENKSTLPLLLSGEKDQAEMIDEAAALIVAESTNQKRKADNLAQRDSDTSKIAPSAGKTKRRRRDNLEINMNNTDKGKNYTRTRSGRRSSPN